MNERIRELAEQADPDHWHSRWYSGINPRVMDPEIKKFAELIVEECVSTLKDMHMWQSVNNQNYPGAWHDAVDQGIEAIKERCGVK